MKLKTTLSAAGALLLFTVVCWFAIRQGLLGTQGLLFASLPGVFLVGLALIPVGFARDFSRRYRVLKSSLRRLQQLALRDDLTGVNNRRHLMDYLQRQKALVDRGGVTFSICYADLDHFKRVNDRYGHVAGDVVLKAFAELASDTVRDVDFVARIGGEEFVLVLTNASARDAFPVAERVRLGMQRMIVRQEDPGFRVTVSMGIAQYCNEENIDELLHRADTALYRAKKRRNSTEISPSIRMVKPINKVTVGN